MIEAVQMYDDKWYLEKFDGHVCCDCLLAHDVEYKIENGRIYTQWKRNDKDTRRERRKYGIKVTKAK